jgi:hypothetical protein
MNRWFALVLSIALAAAVAVATAGVLLGAHVDQPPAAANVDSIPAIPAVASAVLDPADAAFVAAHRSGTLPFSEWTHAAHVRLALCAYHEAQRQPGPMAAILAADIQRFNARHAEKLTVGFHATLTHFWAYVVALFADACPVSEALSFASFWPHAAPVLGDSRLWQHFFTSELLFSSAAKAAVVAPNRRRLPTRAVELYALTLSRPAAPADD